MIYYLIHTLVFIVLLYTLGRKHADPFGKTHLIVTLSLKIIAGLGLAMMYTYYYSTGDTFAFDQESTAMTRFAREDFTGYIRFIFSAKTPPYHSQFISQPRALWMSKIVSIFYLLTGDSYWITSIYLSMLAWWGQWKLAGAFYGLYPRTKHAALFSFLYFPSVIFWGSGLTKESIALWTFGVLMACFIRFYRQGNFYNLLYAGVGFFILWQVKYYYAAALLVALIPVIAQLIYRRPGGRNRAWLIASVILAVFLAGAVAYSHPNFEPDRLLEVIVENNHAFEARSQAGRYAEFDGLKAEWKSILRYFPAGVYVTLFHPYVWEAWNSVSLAAGMENFLLAFLFLTALQGWRRWGEVEFDAWLWLLAGLSYCLILAGFLALSTPNYGTLFRYRIGFLPLWVYLITWANPIFHRIMNKIDPELVALPKKRV